MKFHYEKHSHKMLIFLYFLLCLVFSVCSVGIFQGQMYDALAGTMHPREKNDAISELNNFISRMSDSRSLKHLTPRQDFLLSVAASENAKGSGSESAPYLMNILQSGKLDMKVKYEKSKKSENSSVEMLPMSMQQKMEVDSKRWIALQTSNMNGSSVTSSPIGFRQKLAVDPMNILMAVMIPFSILLAAVLPALFNQMKTGSVNPIISTIASGELYTKRQFLDDSVSILGNLTLFNNKMSEDITKQNRNKKVNILNIILQYITTLVNEKWIKKFDFTYVQRMRSCDEKKC